MNKAFSTSISSVIINHTLDNTHTNANIEKPSRLPDKPTNLIFTGVAGTGKTYRLLNLQKQYDETITASFDDWRTTQLSNYSWCDAICALFLLEDKLMTVPQMMQHPIIQDKAVANARADNISQTLWSLLNSHAHPQSQTVNSTKRSANYYFDKTPSSQWFLLDEVKKDLSARLQDLVTFYKNEQQPVQTQVVSRTTMVSFHQAYGYDEFVEGIRPRINAQTGQMQYDIQNGAFTELCQRARLDPTHRYAMLIDEINRANTAQVFGELMSVIEPSKRAGADMPMTVRLAYSGRAFSVPSNVDIYATMNTQDQSLTLLDTAFRRRFEFIECAPDSAFISPIFVSSSVFSFSEREQTQQAHLAPSKRDNTAEIEEDNKTNTIELALMMQAINQRLYSLFGEEAQLGQSYFMHINDVPSLAARLHRQIIPQIIQQLKATVSTTQIPQLLLQILYDSSDAQTDELQLPDAAYCLLDLYPVDTSIERASSSINPIKYAADSMPHRQQLHPIRYATDFVTIANERHFEEYGSNLNRDNSKESVNNVFLLAKPYQLMYESFKNG